MCTCEEITRADSGMARSTTKGVFVKNEPYEAYWPRTPRQTQLKPLAGRLDNLNGKTIAQLWDFVYRGDEVFSALEEGLKARYPDVRFVNWREFGSTHGNEEHAILASLPERFKELGVEAVISAMGA